MCTTINVSTKFSSGFIVDDSWCYNGSLGNLEQVKSLWSFILLGYYYLCHLCHNNLRKELAIAFLVHYIDHLLNIPLREYNWDKNTHQLPCSHRKVHMPVQCVTLANYIVKLVVDVCVWRLHKDSSQDYNSSRVLFLSTITIIINFSIYSKNNDKKNTESCKVDCKVDWNSIKGWWQGVGSHSISPTLKYISPNWKVYNVWCIYRNVDWVKGNLQCKSTSCFHYDCGCVTWPRPLTTPLRCVRDSFISWCWNTKELM